MSCCLPGIYFEPNEIVLEYLIDSLSYQEYYRFVAKVQFEEERR